MEWEEKSIRGQSSHQLSFADGFIDPSLYALDEELKKGRPASLQP